MKKPTKARLISISLIVLLDIILLPWILKFPSLLKDSGNINVAYQQWLKCGIAGAYKSFLSDKKFLMLFLVMQLPVITFIIYVAWNVDKFKKKNRVKDGIGGPEPAGDGQHGTSRWQNEKEMDKTATVWYTNTDLKAGGIIYGMKKINSDKEKIWINTDDVHTLIIGATRSGKSRKIILPSIWEIAKSGESMILGDPKGELYISSKEYLEKMGYKVIVLNFREPAKGNQWNMLEMVNRAVDEGDVPKATEMAWDIANAISHQKPSTSSEPIWENGEESTIAALILLTVLNSEFRFQKHMTTAYYLLAEYGQPLDDESVPLMDYIRNLPVRHPAKSAFATASIAPYKTRASFFTQALADLRLFSDPNISDMTSFQDHEFESIGIDKTAVFLIIPDEKSTRNVLATLYINQVYQALVELANKRGGRIPRRVNFILDEFGNLPPIPDFDKKITVAGGRGMRFTIAVQDVAQLKKLYDKNSQTITGNCHNWIYIKTADVETAKLISEKTGKYTVETDNTSSSVQSKGHSRSYGVSLTGRSLLLPDEVLRWDNNNSLVMPISYFPARYPLPDLSEYKANKEFGFRDDREYNRQLIEERWNNVITREIQEVTIWLPDLEEGGKIEVRKEPAKSPTEAKIEKPVETVEESVPVGDDIKPATAEDINLDKILSSVVNETQNNNDEDDDLDFL
ncbi:MAG TPA: type IV secretory system conjugative DNA transfer family protein [Defluviitaleaceae bacterium]|nr:type IV secretory system conjugative DNA transfer family protein [Defluviitaleaceae bacterium]